MGQSYDCSVFHIISKFKYFRLLPGVMFGMLILQQVQAFESKEHEMLGNMAIKTVILLKCGQSDTSIAKNKTDDQIDAQACEILKKINKSDVAGYGDVSACVDYFLTPEKLMAQYDTSNHKYYDQWPQSVCYDRKKMKGKWMQASHANHTHFQKELLVSLYTYHKLAISIAKDRNKLEGALFVNAIGDHYLQDFFAPGHITVRRSEMTDLYANAMHDAANEIGATFHQSDNTESDILVKKISNIQEKLQSKTDDDAESIRKFLEGDMGCLKEAEIFTKEGIKLKGDNLLGRSDGCNQRMVMLAANVLSIEDVLDVYQGNQAKNYSEKYEFRYCKNHEGDWWSRDYFRPDIYAGLPFGYYALGTNEKVTNSNDKSLPYATEMIWTINASKDLFYGSNKGTSRSAILVEAVPRGWVGPSGGTAMNFGLAYGVSAYESDDQKPWSNEKGKGVGASLRATVIFPETETALSLLLQRTNHTGASVDNWGNGWNFRIEQGFTSFLTFFLGWGGDAVADAPGQLGFGHYTSAGIMIAGPTSRIKGLFKPDSEVTKKKQFEENQCER